MIRSDERLDYPRVDRIFAGAEEPPSPWAEPLQAARDGRTRRWPKRRDRGGALEIENPEPEFAFDRKGHVASMAPSVQTESHRLIEHLMIAANEQVATACSSSAACPTLYRVHEPPEPEAVAAARRRSSPRSASPRRRCPSTCRRRGGRARRGDAPARSTQHVRRTRPRGAWR